MRFFRFIRYFALMAGLVFVMSSCEQCPIMNKFCCPRKAVDKTGLAVTDIRVGSADKGAFEGRIEFGAGEKITITFRVDRFTTASEKSEGKNLEYYYLRQDLSVRDRNGGVALLMPAVINEKKIVQAMPRKFSNTFSLSNIEGLKPGNYTVTLLVTDLIGFQTATADVPIIIKGK